MKKKLNLFRGLAALTIMLLPVLVSGCPDGTTNRPVSETYTVSYDRNGADSGSVPVDSALYGEGDTVTVLGNTGTLGKTDCSFTGWNTEADGSGTVYSAGSTFVMEAADKTLYAQWLTEKVTLAISISAENGYTREKTFTVSFIFNKDVTGFESSDISITNGTISGFTGGGEIYSAAVTAGDEGDVVISAADRAATADNGYSSELTVYTVHYDITAPAAVEPVITAIGGGKLTMIWNEPTGDPSFDHVLVSYDDSPQVRVSKGTTSYTFNGLEIGESYCPLIFTVDAAGNTTEYPGEGLSEYMEDDVFRTLYHVKNASDLAAMADDLYGYYIIDNNIDLQGITSWTPVGTESDPFTGIISGGNQSWTIRNITNMKVSAGDDRGLLGVASSAYVHNINFKDSSVAVADGNQNCGLLAGCYKDGRIENVEVIGNVGSDINGTNIGGLTGCISNTVIKNIRALATIKGKVNCGAIAGASTGNSIIELSLAGGQGLAGAESVGGLVGLVDGGTLEISESFASNEINSAAGTGVAGLCGKIDGTLIVSNCYTDGSIVNTGGTYTGGLFGYSSINSSTTCTNSYANGAISGAIGTGGLFGYLEGPAQTTGCFFTTDTGQGSARGDIDGDGDADGSGTGQEVDATSMGSIITLGNWSTDIWTYEYGYLFLVNNVPF